MVQPTKGAAMAEGQAHLNHADTLDYDALRGEQQELLSDEQINSLRAEAAGERQLGQDLQNSIDEWQNDGQLPEGEGVFDQITQGSTERMDEMTQTYWETRDSFEQGREQYDEQVNSQEQQAETEQQQAEAQQEQQQAQPEPEHEQSM